MQLYFAGAAVTRELAAAKAVNESDDRMVKADRER
jgi:hypothetical protein